MSKQRNPDFDYGFHSTIPRIVRTEYKAVTPIQKWLYTCLKDLCGDNGTCYRTLRVLSDETGISTGLLSESIPVLHREGLIHAEKKKRKEGGKEVWHITIIDIWQANGKAHPTKRSHGEQTNVHNMNIHSVNENSLERSHGEQECSQIPHRSNNTISNNITEANKDTITSAQHDAPDTARVATANAPTLTSLSELSLEELQAEIARRAQVQQQQGAPTDGSTEPTVSLTPDTAPSDTSRSSTSPVSETQETHQQPATPTPVTGVPIASTSTPGTTEEQGVEEEREPDVISVPVSAPVMAGKWTATRLVEYAMWRNEHTYTRKQYSKELEKARKIKRDYPDLTLEQYKSAYDQWMPWWSENKGYLHTSDMAGCMKNGLGRVQYALDRLEQNAKKASTPKGASNVVQLPQPGTKRGNGLTVQEIMEIQKNKSASVAR